MPLCGVTTYVPTVDAFAAHWGKVNDATPRPLILHGGANLSTLDGVRQQLILALNDTVGKENVRLVAVGDRVIKNAELRGRFQEFRALVARVPLAKSYKQMLPKTPSSVGGGDALISALEAMIQIWTVINRNNPPVPKFHPPLLLSGRWTLETMGRELAAFRQACVAAKNADSNVIYSRELRDRAMKAVVKFLKAYEFAALRHLGAGHELAASIPEIWPDPARLPAPPVIDGEWHPEVDAVLLTWTHPDPKSLKRFGLRSHPGPRYKMEEEELVESIPTDRSQVKISYGLAAHGSSATYKLYAIAPDGGESGSNTIRVVRP